MNVHYVADGIAHPALARAQVALTLGAAYLAYALAEWFALSGVLSLFFCAIALGHYNWCAPLMNDEWHHAHVSPKAR